MYHIPHYCQHKKETTNVESFNVKINYKHYNSFTAPIWNYSGLTICVLAQSGFN